MSSKSLLIHRFPPSSVFFLPCGCYVEELGALDIQAEFSERKINMFLGPLCSLQIGSWIQRLHQTHVRSLYVLLSGAHNVCSLSFCDVNSCWWSMPRYINSLGVAKWKYSNCLFFFFEKTYLFLGASNQ